MDRSGYFELLHGKGIEVGALHEPSKLPPNASVEYFDLRSREESCLLFTELNPDSIVDVDHIGDIDQRHLRRLGKGKYDFVIAMHVIEHVANPIALIEDAFYILRPGGIFVLAAPDKRYTFDKKREITSTAHCISDYLKKVTVSSDDHYIDFIENVLPDGRDLNASEMLERIELVRNRREHPHVWDSKAFRELLQISLKILEQPVEIIREEDGEDNAFEYRTAMKKLSTPNSWSSLFKTWRANKALSC